MNIRLATPDDLPGILAISNHYALTTPANFAVEPETIEQWRTDFDATHEQYAWLVAEGEEGTKVAEHQGAEGKRPEPEADSSVVGFAKASPWKGRCAYAYSCEVTVYVRADAHGRGIGRALYARLIDTCRAQGYRSLVGGITQPNEASVRLHESLGFKRVALFRKIGWKFEKWHDVGYWQLQLNDATDVPGAVSCVVEAVRRLEA